MKFSGIDVSDLVASLGLRGFDYVGVGRNKGWLKFKGQLAAHGQMYSCDMEVHEDADRLPLFWLTDIPSDQAVLKPHLSTNGSLCYIARDSAIFDPFDPIGQTLQALAEAQRVLNAVLEGEMTDDLADEFYAHWGGRLCALDIQEEKATDIQSFELVGPKDLRWMVITDDKMRTEAKLKCLGLELSPTKVVATQVLTKARPIPYQSDWPPKTVAELLEWQRKLDPDCARAIEADLLRRVRARVLAVVVVIESPRLQYAFRVDLHLPPNRPGKPLPFRQQLGRHKIACLTVARLDDRYLAQRNLPSGKSLASLDIVLVGCGTIGGYLAEMLVKAGAGTGQNGRLSLCDFEKLQPQNIGRHRLGFANLLGYKSRELVTELKRSAPGAKLEGFTNDAKSENLEHVDLIIDATGEQSLTDWLAWRYDKKVPLMTVWVEGPGQAIRALLKHKPENACPRCISRLPRSYELQVFDKPVDSLMRGHGCESLYVPFPASASIQAAALAMEMVQAWVNGQAAHTFRTRALDTQLTQKTFDCTPARNENCPACST